MNMVSKLALGGIVLAQLSLSGPVMASEMVKNYVQSVAGVVMTGSGECLRTPFMDTDIKLVECGYPAPVEEVDVEVVAAPTAATVTAQMADKIAIAAEMLFGFDSAELTDDAKAVIDERIAHFKGGARLTAPMEIRGHTCSIGSDAYNQQLSERRAQAVADYIVENAPNVNASDVRIMGMGENQPSASNDTPEGRRLNRRAELVAEGEMVK